MKESEFDLKVIKRIKELVKEKGIKYDPNVLCPADDDMADRVWEAGLQLFIEFGAYCQTTERCIRFTATKCLTSCRRCATRSRSAWARTRW